MTFTLDYSCLSRNANDMMQLVNVVNAVRLHGTAQIIVSASPAGSGEKAMELIRRTFREVARAGETFVVSDDPTNWYSFVVTVTRTVAPVTP